MRACRCSRWSRVSSRRRDSTSPRPAVRRWLERGGQFVLLGTGDPALEHEYAQFEMRYPHRASVRLRFDGRYARRIYGGADALLLPSRYEPCGLAQMIGMRYGCVPVARRTGGLADTITDAGDPGGTGVMFDEFNPWALWDALERCLKVYAQPAKWRQLQDNGMARDFSWSRSAREYVDLYERARAARSSRVRTAPVRARAVILAGGEGSRLGVLTEKRAKPAVPFAGKYRIIDFTLSNCVNSGISDVMILTQYRPHSLNEHIASGRAVGPRPDVQRRRADLPAFPGPLGHRLVQGHRRRDLAEPSFVERGSPDIVLVLSGDHIYKMNYGWLIAFHLDKQADVHDRHAQRDARRGHADGDSRDRREPARHASSSRSPRIRRGRSRRMGIYVFGRPMLSQVLTEDSRAPGLLARFRQGHHPAHAGKRAARLRVPVPGLLGRRRNDSRPTGRRRWRC